LGDIRIGTRGSELALWQAGAVALRIAQAGGPPCRIAIIKTSGDRLQDAPLSEAGGKGLFVKELEDALLRHEIDLAVHSSKDMPAVLPAGLVIAAVLPREDPRDAIVLPEVRLKPDATDAGTAGVVSGFSRTVTTLEELTALLGSAPSIGTSSVRRIAQLARVFPGARFVPIRGNLDTRLRKLDGGAHGALVLAAAGLRRLGFASRISLALPVSACVPAPGQGIVAMEMRQDDAAVGQAVMSINDETTRWALDAERALVEALGGGCQTPIGALAVAIGNRELDLLATVAALDGGRAVRASGRAPESDARSLGTRVAAELIAQGAGEMLAH